MNFVIGSVNPSSGAVEYDHYGYNVSEGVSAFFFAAMILTTSTHLIQAVISKRWFLIYTLALGGFVECLGWGGRLWSALSTSWSPTAGGFWASSDNAFLAQITTLIIAPAFLQAANYIILGRLMEILGHQYSRLHFKTYTIMFVTGDIISLVIQGVGGGVASSANDEAGANSGARIMVGGVFFQLVVMVAYTLILTEFTIHYLREKPVTQIHPFAWTSKIRFRRRPSNSSESMSSLEKLDVSSGVRASETMSPREMRRAKIMLFALAFSTLLIFIRSIYRSVELLNGWSGPIITNQVLFDLLDGMLILMSLVLLNILHPLWLIPKQAASQTINNPMTTA